ncbi:20057_t:CDS:2 [Funneliformis geosporum]|uniref:9614_t:CDS:1 n=1 Tax=Funneliformis geosporum TaxID=1117311 RepID=A0A9W4SGD2_9GLOM|nr:9614_t:CDS:2 [Funneliformis geosporum]CAI2169470.1 20057_t:CDS:2 [Funneliformis geosporum]
MNERLEKVGGSKNNITILVDQMEHAIDSYHEIKDDIRDSFHLKMLKSQLDDLSTHARDTRSTSDRLISSPDYILCTNNSTVAKMLVEIKARHNLNLRDHDLWKFTDMLTGFQQIQSLD